MEAGTWPSARCVAWVVQTVQSYLEPWCPFAPGVLLTVRKKGSRRASGRQANFEQLRGQGVPSNYGQGLSDSERGSPKSFGISFANRGGCRNQPVFEHATTRICNEFEMQGRMPSIGNKIGADVKSFGTSCLWESASTFRIGTAIASA